MMIPINDLRTFSQIKIPIYFNQEQNNSYGSTNFPLKLQHLFQPPQHHRRQKNNSLNSSLRDRWRSGKRRI